MSQKYISNMPTLYTYLKKKKLQKDWQQDFF